MDTLCNKPTGNDGSASQPASRAATTKGADQLHLETALKELDHVLGTLSQRAEVPFYGPTLLASMTEKDQGMALRAEQARYEAQPENSALHFCVTAAVALLEVGQVLLNARGDLSPEERERQSRTLIAYTKTAGRSAYRAASILTDQKNY